MQSLYSSAEPPEKMSPERLMSAPLSVLLREAGAEVFESQISDPEFLGGAVQRADGRIVLSMPTGPRSVSRDLVARSLLASMLGVDLPPLDDIISQHRV